MKRIIMAMLAILTAMGGAYAQNDTIRGTVIDNKKEPIPGATVQLKDCQESAVTDIDGRFMITSPCKSNKLIVNYVGFKEKKMKIKSDDMLIKLTKKGWRYAPDYYQWFVGANVLLGSVDMADNHEYSQFAAGFSLIGGRVKNWGWFGKLDIVPHGDTSAWDFTLNGMVRLWSPVHMYLGVGVGQGKEVVHEYGIGGYGYGEYIYNKRTEPALSYGWIFHHPSNNIAFNLGVSGVTSTGAVFCNMGFSYYFNK